MKSYEEQLKRYETSLLLKNFSTQTREMYLRRTRSFHEFRLKRGMESPFHARAGWRVFISPDQVKESLGYHQL